MEQYPYFPMFIDISKKKIVVIGAGKIARRRIETLTKFASCITVVSPDLNDSVAALEQSGKIAVRRKKYEKSDIEGADIVLAATNDNAVNDAVWADCKALGITVNVCSDVNKDDFFFPGVAVKGGLVIGVTASGSDHSLARRASERVREIIDEF